jgi:hypothetical protein
VTRSMDPREIFTIIIKHNRSYVQYITPLKPGASVRVRAATASRDAARPATSNGEGTHGSLAVLRARNLPGLETRSPVHPC